MKQVSKEEARRRRQQWPFGVFHGTDPGDSSVPGLTPAEGLAMTWRLIEEGTRLHGGEISHMPRSEWPFEIVDRSDIVVPRCTRT